MQITRNSETGKVRFVSMTEAEYIELSEEYGLCLGCDHEQTPVEPDARGVRCESCGKPFVFGFQRLLLMGGIQLSGEVTSKEQLSVN